MSGNAPSIDCGPFLSEANIERELDMLRDEIREEGRAEGREIARAEVRKRVATDMLRNGEPLAKIKMYSRLTEAEILTIAASLGISPA